MGNFLDAVKFNPTAGGTTDWTYSSAVVGYQSPAAAGAIDGASYRYRAESADQTQWEIGYGVYSAGTGVLTRAFVLSNSAGTTAKISFTAAPTVGIVLTASDLQTVPLPQGRLSLTPGVAITTSDVAAATTVYYSASQAPISDGVSLTPMINAQLSLALDATTSDTGYHQSGKNFDVFKFNDAGTIRIGTGPAWTSDTARSAAISLLGNTGIYVNTSSMTARWGSATGNTSTIAAGQGVYLGTIRTTGNGQVEDSAAKRFVWNCYNQQPREMSVVDATANWSYTSTTVRQANGNPANQLAFVMGLNSPVSAELQVIATTSTSTSRNFNFGIALDSITTLGVKSILSSTSAGFAISTQKFRSAGPGVGYHYLAWLEQGSGSDTQTWYGYPYSQLTGELWA